MPAWGIHLATAKKILENLQIKKDSFLFGNILPDVNSGYLIKEIKCIKTYDETHYSNMCDIKGRKEYLPNIEAFFYDYKEKMDNPVILGYFVHLLTDYYWNKSFYFKYGILNKEKERIGIRKNTKEIYLCSREEARQLKVNDFNIFSQTLYKENMIELPIIKEDLSKEIEEIKSIQINKEDLQIIEDYLKKEEKRNKGEEILKSYQIYTKKEIYEEFENSISFILQSLQSLENIKN